MSAEWHSTTLGNIAAAVYGLVDGPFGSNLPASLYQARGIPVIRGSNLSLGKEKFKMQDFVFVSDETANRLARSICKAGDIIFTKKGTLGQTGLIPKNTGYDRFLLSSNQMKLTVDPSKADSEFVFYWVSSEASRTKLVQDASITGVPKTNLQYIQSFPILLPPLAEQKAIAHILGTLDDKIELNCKMNETLEAMARALFKSWFVDFDPVRKKQAGQPTGLPAEIDALFPGEFEDSELGEVPKGWRVEALSSIADFKNGLALQKFRPANDTVRLPAIKIAQLRTGEPDSEEWATDQIDPACIIENGDVIFSWSGSLTVVVWCGGRGALNQHLFKVTSKQFPKWFYLQYTLSHLLQFQQIASDKATTMGHIQRHHLDEAICAVPPRDLIEAATKVFEPWLAKRISADLEARHLRTIRDALLPKLISGELRVKDAERFVGGNKGLNHG